MKRLTAIILTAALVCGVFSLLPASAVDSETAVSGDYGWTGTAQVYAAAKGARYFRTKLLNDGSVGAVYYRSGLGNYFARSYDGGITFQDEVRLLPNATDSANAASPYVTEEMPYGRGRLEAQNPNLVEMPDGKIMVFHRYNTYTGEPAVKPWSIYYASICYQISSDGGKTWTEPQVMVKCTKEKALDSSSSDYGFWEPDPYIINGKLFVYYADTYTPADLRYQHIMYCIWDEEEMKFGEPQMAQNGIEHLSRDGMSVVTRLNDGSYAMVFESTKTGNTDNTFVIKMSLSLNGIDWTHPVIVASPDTVLEETAAASSEKAVCASPHIVTLPDGRVAVSYQTTDRYTGIIPDRVSYRVGTQVIVSKKAIGYDSFSDFENGMGAAANTNATELFAHLAGGPDKLSENEFSKSASMLYANGYLMIYYNVGKNTDAYTHSIGAVNVSYAKISTDTDYGDINNYTVLNAKGNTVTEENGTFTLPASTTTLLAADNNAENTVEISYEKSDYTLYSGGSYTADFNAENKTVSTTSTGKALFNNTEHLTAFKATVNVEGNPATGAMQGGFAFHIQKEDFEDNYFNTSGYSVFVRRLATDLSKAEIVYRYCTGGTNVYSFVAGTYDGLAAEELDLKFTLRLVVNQNKFYAQLCDQEGKVIINAGEAPLNETISEKNPDYYPAGSLALISHGKHTFSDITLTETVSLVKTDYLRAKAIFTTASAGDNQTGFAFRAQGSEKASPGYSGYVVKLVKSDSYEKGTIKLQLTRYGTDSTGEKFKNLGNVKTYTDTTVLNGAHPSAASLIMEAVVEGSSLTVTLTNPEKRSLTSSYSFDLTAPSGAYSDYYANGGFGFFNHGSSEVTVSNAEFSTVKNSLNNINDTDFTVYEPVGGEGTRYIYNSFKATNISGKKIMLNDTVTADFTANATFTVADNGEIKTGIIFRSQSVGNGIDDMEGYSVVLVKRANAENNGQVQLVVFKWVRSKTGALSYYGILKSIYDNNALNSVIPEAKASVLASAHMRIKLNVTVSGNEVTAYFDVLDGEGNTAATSEALTYDLTTKRTVSAASKFSSDGANTLFGAGQVGVSINTRSSLCDFNITTADSELEDRLITAKSNDNGLVYTTVNSGAAQEGSLVKVVALANDGYRLSSVNVTVNSETEELLPTDGEYSFTKVSGATDIFAVFKMTGDIDGDGLINSADLVSLKRHLIGKSNIRLTDGDINQSGSIDIIDLIKLKKLLQ